MEDCYAIDNCKEVIQLRKEIGRLSLELKELKKSNTIEELIDISERLGFNEGEYDSGNVNVRIMILRETEKEFYIMELEIKTLKQEVAKLKHENNVFLENKENKKNLIEILKKNNKDLRFKFSQIREILRMKNVESNECK